MTAIDVEVLVGTAPDLEVELQLGDAPAVDVAVTFGPPSLTILSVLPTGPRGPAGQDGTDGTDGVGVPTGGTTGQVLAKDSDTDFDTEWIDAAAGGSGLPDPWTSDQTSGEVTATTDGTDATALIVEAVTGQTEPMLVVKNEDGGNTLEALPNGDLVVPVPEGTGRNVTAGDTSGDVFASFDVTNDVLVSDLRRGGLGLYAQNDGGTVRSQAYADAGLTGVSTDSGRRAVFEVNSANDGLGGFARLLQDDNKAEIAVGANVGQTLPLVDLKDENGVSVTRVLVSGAIGTSSGEPADADIAQGEMFVYRTPTLGAPVAGLKFRDENDDYWIAEIPMTLVP